MKIQEIVLFAYATRGEALEVANHTVEDTTVAAIHILKGRAPGEKAVCYAVVPSATPLLPSK